MTKAAHSSLLGMRVSPDFRQALLEPDVVRGSGSDSDISTHPVFLSGIVRDSHEIRVAGVMTAEGGGREQIEDMTPHFRRAGGYTDWAAAQGVALVGLNADDHERLPINGCACRSEPFARRRRIGTHHVLSAHRNPSAAAGGRGFGPQHLSSGWGLLSSGLTFVGIKWR
jgi:hypothetical protein